MPASGEKNGAGVPIDDLLSAPSGERETALRRAGLLNPDGLALLLDNAERFLGSDPGKARELAELCCLLAARGGDPAAAPRAAYVLAGAHGIDGDLDEELLLTRRAREGYLALGRNLEALRTNVGLMGVLIELGRYDEALEAGREVLDSLAGRGGLRISPTREQADLLVALVQQNIGGCYEYMGRYDEALEAYGTSEERYDALGATERVGEVLSNRGAILMHLGRGNDALAAHEQAAEIFEGAGLTFLHAKALANIGEAHLRLANYAESLRTLERARRLFSSLKAPVEEHILLLDTADAYLQLNLYSEALAAYAEACEALREAGLVHDRARALWGMGSALAAMGEAREAESALDEAATMFAAAENAPMLSGVMLERASLLAARGDRASALRAAEEALESVRGGDRPAHRLYAHLRVADLLIHDTAAAEAHLAAAREDAGHLALPHLSYRLKERLGRLRLLQGRHDEARALLEEAIAEIERLRDGVGQEVVRTSFLRDKMAPYEDLLRLHLARGDAEGNRLAYAAAERAKSRTLVDLLTGGIARYGTLDEALQRELLALKTDLNATYGELLAADDGTPVGDLRARAQALEAEIRRLHLRAAASDLFFAPPRDEEEHEAPMPEETLLCYHVVGDEVIAFVRSQDELQVVRQVCSVGAVVRVMRQLDSQWDRFRAGAAFVSRHAPLLERSTRRLLADLNALLAAPLEPVLREAAERSAPGETPKLTVIPHGPLHRVPFHALYDGERYLLERFEVAYAPSARVHAICRNRSVGKDAEDASPRSLVIGVADPLIPAATTEARAVAARLPGAELLLDEEATVEALRQRAPGRRFVHLACHGLFRSDNPMFSSLRLHDGWMTAADAMQLDLDGALVTLSACESGRTEVLAGDELIGLTRAFLGAGASALAVSLWVVQDDSTALFMESWYAKLRDGMDRAGALRATQLELKERFPHPYYWAPFVLIGRR